MFLQVGGPDSLEVSHAWRLFRGKRLQVRQRGGCMRAMGMRGALALPQGASAAYDCQ